MRKDVSWLAVCSVSALLFVGCGQEPDSVPAPPAAPAATTVAPTTVAAPEAVAPVVPPPGSAGAVTAPIAEPAPMTDSDLLGGNGRPLTEEEKMLLNYGIDMFKNDKGHYPKDLAEAVANKYITRMPRLPADEQLNYDPQTGRVTVTKKGQ